MAKTQRVTHFYGLFSCSQGLPISYVVLCEDELTVSCFKSHLLGLGRIAATICSSAPELGFFNFQMLTQSFIGYKLSDDIPFFILLSGSYFCTTDLSLKCIQIAHFIHLLYTPTLMNLGKELENKLVQALNNASFAGGGDVESCEDYREDIFSMFEDHYVLAVLTHSSFSSLFSSPVLNYPQLKTSLRDHTFDTKNDDNSIVYGMSLCIVSDNEDEIEIPLLGKSSKFLCLQDNRHFRNILHLYHLLQLKNKSTLNKNDGIILHEMLGSTVVFSLHGDITPEESEAVLVISATHKPNIYIAMSVPCTWINVDNDAQNIKTDHVMGHQFSEFPVILPESGLYLYPLDALPSLVNIWRTVLSRFLLFCPLTSPPIEEMSTNDMENLLTPTPPTSQTLGALQPKPPLEAVPTSTSSRRPYSRSIIETSTNS